MLYNLCAAKNYASLIMLGFLVVLFIVMLVVSNRQKKKQQKEIQEKLDSLKVGDRVKTIGLICGIVVDVNPEENTFVLETGTEDKKSYVKFDKGAIYQTAPAQGSAVAAEETKAEEPAPVQEEVKSEEPAAEETKTEEKK